MIRSNASREVIKNSRNPWDFAERHVKNAKRSFMRDQNVDTWSSSVSGDFLRLGPMKISLQTGCVRHYCARASESKITRLFPAHADG